MMSFLMTGQRIVPGLCPFTAANRIEHVPGAGLIACPGAAFNPTEALCKQLNVSPRWIC
jgi:hypothetical protein